LKEALYLVWRTLIQYGDDYGVKKLAQQCGENKEPVFMDYQSWDDMDFCDRKQIRLELALGMQSEENALGRLQIIQKCQNDLYTALTNLVGQGTMTPEMYQKIKKPFADTLYVLGVKDCNTYLPSDDEVAQMIEQGKAAQQNKEPSPEDKQKLSVANLNDVRAKQIEMEVAGQDAESQLDFMSMAAGDPKVYS
jgi:hypothetical protein